MKRLPDDLSEKLLSISDRFGGTGLDISIDDVATMADVPRATLYYYFSGKDDLVSFYLNDKFTRVGDAVVKAARGEGSVADRLEAALTAILAAMGEHPAICVELPAAVKHSSDHDYQDVMMSAERVVMAPLRELLVEGRASGELDVTDPQTTAVGLMGAITMVGMMQVVTTGEIDAEGTAPLLVPTLIRGLLPR